MADRISRIKIQKLFDLDETHYSGDFEVTDYESEQMFRINAQFCVHGTIQLSYNILFSEYKIMIEMAHGKWSGS